MLKPRIIPYVSAGALMALLFFMSPAKASITSLDCVDVDGDIFSCAIDGGVDEGENCYFYHDGNIWADFYGEPCTWNAYDYGTQCSYAIGTLGASGPFLHLEVRTGVDVADSDDNEALASGTFDCDTDTWTDDDPPPEEPPPDASASATDRIAAATERLVFVQSWMLIVAVSALSCAAGWKLWIGSKKNNG